MPEISIIVPVYNVEKYIRRCLDSIQSQTFDDWECICVDDGTPDNSGKICDEYAAKDSRFVVLHKKNGGVSSARNAGLDAAKGKWICFCDSDDWEESNFFEKSISLCEADTDIVKSGYRIIADTKVENELLPCDYSENEQVSCVHTSCHFIKKSYLLEHNIKFPENITLAEDWFFNYQLQLYKPNVVSLNEVTYNYFQNDSSVMHSLTQKNIEDEIAIIKKAQNMPIRNDELILLRTFDVRSEILYILQDFALYRRTFPETLKEQFKKAKVKEKIVISFLIFHFDFIVKFYLLLRKRRKAKC